MGNLFAELKRRHIYRVAAAYAVVAWLLLQIVNNVVPIMQAPAWVGQVLLLVLVLGFPLAIFFAWMRELPSSDRMAPQKATATDWALIAILLTVLAAVGYQELTPLRTATVAPDSVAAARAAAAAPAGVSVAVLPFANLSDDKQQEFFSDGMTEEIMTALAKIPDLRVVARESAFQYKGAKNDMRTVGQALSATHLIEGSVRRAGDRVRVTAQLVKAEDGVNIWADSYDRDLTDVFAIQEDIARAIAASLRMPLGLKPGENLVNNRSIDPDSYQQFLQAKALYRARFSPAGPGTGLKTLNEAAVLLGRNAGFAPGWALASLIQAQIPNYTVAQNAALSVAEMRAVVQSSRAKAEPAARKAIALDPDLPDGYLALAALETRAGNFARAEELEIAALKLDGNSPEALNDYSQLLAQIGFPRKALPLKQQAHALEPFVPIWNRNYGIVLWLTGDDDAAIATLKPVNAIFVSLVQASAGRFQEAAETLAAMTAVPARFQSAADEAIRILRLAPSSEVPPPNVIPPGTLDTIYLYTGAPERVLNYYERNADAGWMANFGSMLLWHPAYAPVRKTERFKALVRKTGMVAYWRAKGWPDACHPTTADDFECN